MYILGVGLDIPYGSLPIQDSVWFYDYSMYSILSEKKKKQINPALAFFRTLSHVMMPEDKKNVV